MNTIPTANIALKDASTALEIKPSPTDASKVFLERTRQSIKAWIVILPVATMFTLGSGLVGDPALSDIAQGNYRSAAIKGVIAGLSLAPLAVKTFRRR